MSHPRATFPPGVITAYQSTGLRRTCASYGTSYRTLRRWLVERGVAIRPHGQRIRGQA